MTILMPQDAFQSFLASQIQAMQAMVADHQRHVDRKFDEVQRQVARMATKEDLASARHELKAEMAGIKRTVGNLDKLRFSALTVSCMAMAGVIWGFFKAKFLGT